MSTSPSAALGLHGSVRGCAGTDWGSGALPPAKCVVTDCTTCRVSFVATSAASKSFSVPVSCLCNTGERWHRELLPLLPWEQPCRSTAEVRRARLGWLRCHHHLLVGVLSRHNLLNPTLFHQKCSGGVCSLPPWSNVSRMLPAGRSGRAVLMQAQDPRAHPFPLHTASASLFLLV